MSFETVVTISAITEIIVISAISLTIINAFSHGALGRLVWGQKKQAPAGKTKPSHREEAGYRQAA